LQRDGSLQQKHQRIVSNIIKPTTDLDVIEENADEMATGMENVK